MNHRMIKSLFTFVFISLVSFQSIAQKKVDILAYYYGNGNDLEKYQTQELTHIIFSFLHLQGNRFAFDNETDEYAVKQLVKLKKKNPNLKVLLALGGWGGCESCSKVFAKEKNRQAFAKSVLKILQKTNTDGIDLDWEYPAIQGEKGHLFQKEDKQNFTALIQELRKTLGDSYEISFAAGGFQEFLEESIEWKKVMPLVDRVNIMSYDLVNGNSIKTGHHTSLYSTKEQTVSTNYAVRYLKDLGINPTKLVIGAAFYARVWKFVNKNNNGLYQEGKFKESVSYQELEIKLGEKQGFKTYWDNIAHAPYRYNKQEQLFATYENIQSVKEKTAYAKNNGLGGIMFWQLSGDIPQEGLLNAIIQENKKQ